MCELIVRTALFSLTLTLLTYFVGAYFDGVLFFHTFQQPGYIMPTQYSFWRYIISVAKYIPKTVFLIIITLFILYILEAFMAVFIFGITAAAICNFLIGPLILILFIDFPFEVAPERYGDFYAALVFFIGVGRMHYRGL